MSRRRHTRRPMAEINVVPYIDVMLVLLVIFMITAPLLTQGVKVDLPQADAEPLEDEARRPLVVTVTKAGELFITYDDDRSRAVDEETLLQNAAAILKHSGKIPVLVRGDREVAYGRVVEAMLLLKRAGAPDVGLITEPPER
jgi:biopolymer transport protein TolR